VNTNATESDSIAESGAAEGPKPSLLVTISDAGNDDHRGNEVRPKAGLVLSGHDPSRGNEIGAGEPTKVDEMATPADERHILVLKKPIVGRSGDGSALELLGIAVEPGMAAECCTACEPRIVPEPRIAAEFPVVAESPIARERAMAREREQVDDLANCGVDLNAAVKGRLADRLATGGTRVGEGPNDRGAVVVGWGVSQGGGDSPRQTPATSWRRGHIGSARPAEDVELT
jgi:hypothetical protein